MIDMVMAMEIAGEDRDLLSELANLFLEDYPARVTALRAAISEGDSATVELEAHTIKGAARVIAVDQVCETASELEIMGASGELARAEEVLDQLAALLELLALELNELIRGSNPVA